MKSGAWGVGGASFPSGTTWSAVALGRASRSTSASRTPRHTAVPTAPFSHWRPDAGGLWKLRPFPAHSSVMVWVTASSRLRSSRRSVSGFSTSPSTVRTYADGSMTGSVVVVPDEEELGRRDVGGQLPEGRLEVDRPRAPDDELFLPGTRARARGGGRASGPAPAARRPGASPRRRPGRRRCAGRDARRAPPRLIAHVSRHPLRGRDYCGPASDHPLTACQGPGRPAPLVIVLDGSRLRVADAGSLRRLHRPRILAACASAARPRRLLALVALLASGVPGAGPPKPGGPPHHLEGGFRNLNPAYARPDFWTRWKFVIPRLLKSTFSARRRSPSRERRAHPPRERRRADRHLGGALDGPGPDGWGQLPDRSPVVGARQPRCRSPARAGSCRPAVRFEDLPPIDFVVISHDHYDHLDAATVKRLWDAHRPRFLVPLGLKAWFAELGIDGVDELDWWETPDRQGPHGRVPARPALERAHPLGPEPSGSGPAGPCSGGIGGSTSRATPATTRRSSRRSAAAWAPSISARSRSAPTCPGR